ncbi:TPA: hypothetical protein NM870_003615 [Acinetobacter baumannii]|nr:hypothetical protein [Acinetobacter baumannii]
MKEKPLVFNNESVLKDQRFITLSKYSNAVLSNAKRKDKTVITFKRGTFQSDMQIERHLDQWVRDQLFFLKKCPSNAVLIGGFSI